MPASKHTDFAESPGLCRLLGRIENVLDTSTFVISNLRGLLAEYVGTEQQYGLVGNRYRWLAACMPAPSESLFQTQRMCPIVCLTTAPSYLAFHL